MNRFTLAITTYERLKLTLESFAKVVDDPRIDEIIILDDCSEFNLFMMLAQACGQWAKVKTIRQGQNRGMQQNKADAVAFARNEWVILFDSDNVLTTEYLDSIPEYMDECTIHCPSFARPMFDMRWLEGRIIDREDAKDYADKECFHWMINTCNYVVNRDEYAKVYKHDPEQRGTDTAAFALRWLEAGNSFYIMPGAYYDHLVHGGSEFMKHVDYNMAMAKSIMNKIKNL